VQGYHFAGYRLIRFSAESKEALWEIAERLIPNEEFIVDKWITLQTNAWEPPGFTRDELRAVFSSVFRSILSCMKSRELELCVAELEEVGTDLAFRGYPFQALVVSIHFLEQSYMPLLVEPLTGNAQRWFVAMDEFLHAVLAAIATSYFESNRKELLEQAEVGRIVQEGLLANIPRTALDLEIAHIYISAHEQAQLGGDFVDFLTLDNGSVAFVIGDLVGHGLEAAADSVLLRSLFRGFMRENPDIADAMTRLNRVLVSELKPSVFATAQALQYDPGGKLRLVNAGHPYPIICNDECGLLPIDGGALSILENLTYSTTDLTLEPGTVLVAYTDGLTEARRSRMELFGEERAIDEVTAARGTSARAIAEHLVDSALRHAGGKFIDDVAVLVIKRRNNGVN